MFLYTVVRDMLYIIECLKECRHPYFTFCYMLFQPTKFPPFNRPFSSSKNFHFQNEAQCKIFLLEMSFICVRLKNDYHINGFAFSLAFKQRL